MLSPEQFQNWAARAARGEDVVYAIGERPDPAIAPVARQLAEAGVVALTSRRAGNGFRFIAQRLPDPRPSQMRARTPVNRGRFVLSAHDGKMTTRAVLRVLAQAANRGLPCPTNAELARRVGLNGPVAASYRVRRLVQAGLIVVDEPSPVERRVVTIVATGKSTVRGAL
jgi:hypothetical protein